MENNIVKNFLRSFKDSMMAMSIDSLKEEQLKVFYNNFKDVKDSFVPEEPTNIIRYIAKTKTQPTSTWIESNCSENVFDDKTGKGYLVLNEDVNTVKGKGKPIKNIFNDKGSDSNVESVILPSQITSIGDYAFYGCKGLTSVTISNSVTEIGTFAFENCSGLISVTIPNSVITIGDSAFEFCKRLASVICEATKPPALGFASFANIIATECVVPKGCVEAYESSKWSSANGGQFTTFKIQ